MWQRMRGLYRERRFFLFCFLFFIALASVGCGADRKKEPTADRSGEAGRTKLFGLNFSPYLDGQDPNQGAQVSEEQLRERIEIIAPFTRWLRTFGSTNGLEDVGRIAHEFGLKVAAGAWIDGDLAANEREISSLIDIGLAGEADLLIVGSEVLLRGNLSKGALIDYIHRVKSAAPHLQVTTAEVYSLLLNNLELIEAVDVVYANFYPYWEGAPVDKGVAPIHANYKRLVAASKGKEVVVSESGWPNGGNRVGDAVPSPENAGFFFLNFVSWAEANEVSYFYFAAFDEAWKEQYEGPQGAHWGVWDKEGILKQEMKPVFLGETMADNWSGAAVPGGAGAPSIEFTFVPPLGSFQNLKGRVLHVDPAHRVVVYIEVNGQWWVKPFANAPLTTITSDGSFVVDITTGGIDEKATRIAAYLIPVEYTPPVLLGSRTIPAELEEKSVEKAEVNRAS